MTGRLLVRWGPSVEHDAHAERSKSQPLPVAQRRSLPLRLISHISTRIKAWYFRICTWTQHPVPPTPDVPHMHSRKKIVLVVVSGGYCRALFQAISYTPEIGPLIFGIKVDRAELPE
ncbi:hypothetical protein H105_02017 [Trichophyton soudanense CBS 452.61]|uniref:Uncharacterized protein n=1 Tax=Trichophyton soudanense CBS 452.61 TaxID=1215331 RepID=A0A022Y266_TRISD|nr:hypothetical protein H100_02003 [Trichophyton rubrum MR850]EZF65994.1 hypothetical protein H104_01987 [Trichophyton rubrum CBS 289.86]EZF76663.1 hypothetical protein H105_02017 [Trichophyton soudanense CBS 452.61]EZG19566.1 hypothetical protein H107_02071 [Trichophyton rubrum CBS 202.88]